MDRKADKTVSKSAEKALNDLMRLCSRAEKSSGDARRLMYKWMVPTSEMEKVLVRLINEGFIDDSRYASAFVRDKMRFSGWGEYRIRKALAQKGIGSELADKALRENGCTDNERLRRVMEKKLQSIQRQGEPRSLRAKLIRYGSSLGHDFEAVFDVADDLLKNINEEI